MQGSTASLGAYLESAPTPSYLLYLIAAGFGLPCSEDALVIWVGSNICKGKYVGAVATAVTLCIVYIGVVVSDMITFGIGLALRMGFLSGLKNRLLK